MLCFPWKPIAGKPNMLLFGIGIHDENCVFCGKKRFPLKENDVVAVPVVPFYRIL